MSYTATFASSPVLGLDVRRELLKDYQMKLTIKKNKQSPKVPSLPRLQQN